MNYRSLSSPDGCLYRLDPDLSVSCLDTGLAVANGIGFSPDGTTMYVSEQFRGRILRYDYDPQTGAASGRRLFAQLPETAGLPDGIRVDSEGCVWNAHWGGGLLSRYAPDGRVLDRIPLPVPVVTCLAFAGERLNELYVTTGWYGLDLKEQRQKPGCGDLFRIRAGSTGLVEPRFRG
jgi:sugar lactone lactonase YvrE